LGSIIPSIAKCRYNNNQILENMCQDLLDKFRNDYKLLEPSYLKLLIERVMSLEFMDTKEAQEIFSEVRDIAIVKKTAIMIAA
jgi:hypothetical protein